MSGPNRPKELPESYRELPDEEALALIMDVYRFDRDYARFFLAIERGKITGNVLKPGDKR